MDICARAAKLMDCMRELASIAERFTGFYLREPHGFGTSFGDRHVATHSLEKAARHFLTDRVVFRQQDPSGADVLPAYTTAISPARHAVRIAGGTEASAQGFDEPNGNVRLLAFEQRRALIGNQQLLTGDQRSQWPAHTAFVFAHRIFPALECILLSTFLERDLLSQ